MSQTLGGRPSEFEAFRDRIQMADVSVETCTDSLISLVKKRQIRGSRDCAEATALLLSRVVETFDLQNANELMSEVRRVGRRLIASQPRELAMGNVVRRVLGIIREELDEDRAGESGESSESQMFNSAGTNSGLHRPARPLPKTAGQALTHETQALLGESNAPPTKTSMLSLLSHSPYGEVSHVAQVIAIPQSLLLQEGRSTGATNAADDLKSEVVEGIDELLDELRQADDQIATYALEQIHSREIILTNSTTRTTQKFLLKAASRRNLTVILVESFPNSHRSAYEILTGRPKGNSRSGEQMNRALTAAGVTVIFAADSIVFGLMTRVTKVILDANIIFGSGSSVTLVGSKLIARAAKLHRSPVLVLGGVYKISPDYPFNVNSLMENGEPSAEVSCMDDYLPGEIEVGKPLFDHIPADLVDLYITNVGSYAPATLYSVVNDHYRAEDTDLDSV